MAVGLFWNDDIPAGPLTDREKLAYVGNNTGNLLFIRALREIFAPKIVRIRDVSEGTFTDDPALPAYLTVELIWLRENTEYPHVWKMLEAIHDKPLIPVSVGIQSESRLSDVHLAPDTVKLLRTMAERAVLGVRGEYTASVLEKAGVVNLRVIGCPSLYRGMDENFRIEKKPFDPKMRACCNFRTFYGAISEAEREFLLFAANREMGFAEQNHYELTLSFCRENQEAFDYFSAWLNRQKRMFFSVRDWDAWVRRYDFSMGSRFHGNVAALNNGIPALWMVIDGRMDEMTRLFRLPTMRMDEFRMDRPLEYYYDLADFTSFNQAYPERMRTFRDFIRVNRLTEAKRG